MKKIKYILRFIGLYILETFILSIIVLLLKQIGIDYQSLTRDKRIIISIIIYLIIMSIFYLIYHKTINKDIIDYKKHFKEYFNIGFKWYTIGLIAMFISNVIIYIFLGQASTNETSVQSIIDIAPLYMIFSTIIYAPFIEELIYRKSLRDIINNNYVFIIVSGLLFGFIHTIAGLEANNYLELLYIIPYGMMGISLATMYVKTNNITVSISIHMLHNAILITATLIRMFIGG